MVVRARRVRLNPSIDDGLVLHLPMSEGSGSRVWDRSPYGNHGNITGATWVDGKAGFGKALNFNGVDQYLTIPYNASLDVSGLITVSLWVYLNETPSYTKNLISKYGRDGWMLRVNNNFLEVDLRNAAGNLTSYYSSKTLTVGAWNFVSFVFNASTLALITFVNGTSKSVVATNDFEDEATAVQIGDESWYANNELNGIIDEIRVYNRVLSPVDVRQLSAQRGRV